MHRLLQVVHFTAASCSKTHKHRLLYVGQLTHLFVHVAYFTAALHSKTHTSVCRHTFGRHRRRTCRRTPSTWSVRGGTSCRWPSPLFQRLACRKTHIDRYEKHQSGNEPDAYALRKNRTQFGVYLPQKRCHRCTSSSHVLYVKMWHNSVFVFHSRYIIGVAPTCFAWKWGLMRCFSSTVGISSV